MSYFIYNPTTYKRLIKGNGDAIRAETERAAKAQLTKSGVDKNVWKIIPVREFYDNEPDVEVINLMSKLPCKIKISERGGCCDPSTERYWQM